MILLSVLSLTAAPAASGACSADPASGRLIARLAQLDAALPGKVPGGSDPDGTVFAADWWMRGFWAGAWWQAYALTGDRALADRATEATRRLDGGERTPSHDVGFVYGRSDAAGYDLLCSRAPRPGGCGRLRARALRAARTLLDLAAFNRAAGTIPTGRRCRLCRPGQTDTIIDSMANLPLLTWAWRVTHRDVYARVVRRHATTVAAWLVRADGSTAQSAHSDRRTGRLRRVHTHQGYSATSAWARGQAWALYGYARVGVELGDQRLVRTAMRVAAFWRRRVSDGTLPRWDLDAPSGPQDTSAAAVAAAGLGWLARADPTGPWRDSGRALLAAVSARVRSDGRLAGQVLHYPRHLHGDDAELLLGVDYTLEAQRLLGCAAAP